MTDEEIRAAREHLDASMASIAYADALREAVSWGFGMAQQALDQNANLPVSVVRECIGPESQVIETLLSLMGEQLDQARERAERAYGDRALPPRVIAA
jgi:hypothetical protein